MGTWDHPFVIWVVPSDVQKHEMCIGPYYNFAGRGHLRVRIPAITWHFTRNNKEPARNMTNFWLTLYLFDSQSVHFVTVICIYDSFSDKKNDFFKSKHLKAHLYETLPDTSTNEEKQKAQIDRIIALRWTAILSIAVPVWPLSFRSPSTDIDHILQNNNLSMRSRVDTAPPFWRSKTVTSFFEGLCSKRFWCWIVFRCASIS